MGQWVTESIYFDCNVCDDFQELSESHYLMKIFDQLQGHIDRKIVLKSSNYANIPTDSLPACSSEDLLIYLSEDYRKDIPKKIREGFSNIHRCYASTNTEGHVYAFPLGYEKGMGDQFKSKPWDLRIDRVFFAGALNVNRHSLYKEIFHLSFLPDYWINRMSISRFSHLMPKSKLNRNTCAHFSGGFKQGLDTEQYAKELSNSRIALCPKGYHTAETFRHYEALKSGCIVISERLPDTWMYKGSPIVQLNSWRELRGTVKRLFRDPAYMEALHVQSLLWWDQKLSPKAVSDRIIKHLE
jgi:hypothetical protein